MSVQTVKVQLADGSVQRLTQAQLQEQINQGKITADAARPYLLQFEDQEVGDNVQFSNGAKDKPPVDEKTGNPGADAAAQNVAGTKALSDAITKAQEGDTTAIIDLAKAGNKDAIDFCNQNGVKLDEAKPVSGRDYVVGVAPQKIYDLFDAIDGTKEGVTPQQKQEALDELYSLMPNSISKEPTANGTSFYDYAVYLLQTNGYEDKDKKIPEMQAPAGVSAGDHVDVRSQSIRYNEAEAKAQTSFDIHRQYMLNAYDKINTGQVQLNFGDQDAKVKKHLRENERTLRGSGNLQEIVVIPDSPKEAKKAAEARYEQLVKEAKANGTWDDKYPPVRKLFGGTLRGIRNMATVAKRNLEEQKKQFAQLAADYDALDKQYNDLNAQIDNAGPNERATIIEQMQQIAQQKSDIETRATDLAKTMAKTAIDANIFNEDGSINKDAYQFAMYNFAGDDYRGNIDERKALINASGDEENNSKKMTMRDTGKAFRAANFESEQNHQLGMQLGVAALELGLGFLTGLLGGSLLGKVTATAVGSVTTITNTVNTTTTRQWVVDVPGTEGKWISVPDGQGGYTQRWQPGTEEVGHWAETTTAGPTSSTSETKEGDAVTNTAKISPAKAGLLGMLGAAPGALMHALSIRDNGGRDRFRGLTADKVVKGDPSLSEYTNTVIQATRDYARANGVDDDELALMVQLAIGGTATKKANDREIAAIVPKVIAAIDYLKDHPEAHLLEKDTELTQVEGTSKPDPVKPTKPTDPIVPPDEPDEPVKGEYHVHEPNYFFDVKGRSALNYIEVVYPNFHRLSDADKQKVIAAFDEANPNVRGHEYYYGRQYDKPDGSGKFDQKGLPVYFPEVDLGDGRTLKPDLSKKPKPGRIVPGKGGKRRPFADPNGGYVAPGNDKSHVDNEKRYPNTPKGREDAAKDDAARKKTQNQ